MAPSSDMSSVRPQRLSRLLWSLVALATLCLCTSFAKAQTNESALTRVAVLPLVLPSDTGSAEERAETVAEVNHVLRASNHDVTEPSASRMKLLAYGRFPAQTLSDDEKAEFQRLVREAWIAVGRQDHAAARSAIGTAMAYARERLEILNRNDALAATLINLCLLTPRVLVDQGASRQLVVLETMECRKLVPHVAPSEQDLVPEVLSALKEADRHMSTLAPATLQVNTAASNNCSVLLNGHPVGKVPLSTAVTPGTYLAQVECAQQRPGTGFVHEITLSGGKTTVLEAEAFEPYVRADLSGLYITKDNDNTRGRDLDSMLASLPSLARRLHVDRIVLVGAPMHGGVRLHVVRNDTAAGQCGTEAPRAELTGKLASLMVCADKAAPALAGTQVQGENQGTEGVRDRSHTQRNWGIALASIGVGVLGGAWIGHGATSDRNRGSMDHVYQGLGGAGAAFIVSSEPLWMPVSQQHAPWWAWAGMAVGIAPVVWSAILWADDTTCVLKYEDESCATVENTRTPAALTLATSVPLLTLPASFYVARAIRGHADVSLHSSFDPRTQTAALGLTGTF